MKMNTHPSKVNRELSSICLLIVFASRLRFIKLVMGCPSTITMPLTVQSRLYKSMPSPCSSMYGATPVDHCWNVIQ
ncbi:hypothetical protein D3C80_2174240 [compost metagenome]